MLNKKIELKMGDVKIPLWYNNYAVFELQSMYGVDNSEILLKVTERAKENHLLLIADLIKIGIKGHSLALNQTLPDYYDNVNLLLADADMGEVMQVWQVFIDVMGGNIESDKKKVTKTAKKKK